MYCFDLFFFLQSTAYDLRISDWSSVVCSSDLSAWGRWLTSRRYNRGMNTVPARHAPETPTQPCAATPLRFVTAASLFDGHDAAINIMRRLIQRSDMRGDGKVCVSMGRCRW